jgi:hypothetical protein
VLKEAINQLFHSTLLNDNQIGARLTERGLQTTGRQVKTIRLKSGWQRHSTGAQKAARAAQTLHQVEQVVTHGPGRTFGRGWMITYLRQHCGFKAHQNDVATAQRQLNPEGVAARRPGGRKKRLENYITSGPNFLWCLDGHDKLAQFGIQIYAAVDAYSRKIIWYYCGCVAAVIEQQLVLFASTLLPSNLSVYAPGLYAPTEAQRQSYLPLCISPYSLRPAWPNSGPRMSTQCYRSHNVISTARALIILRLKVYGDNNDSNALTHGSITSRHSRLKISTGKTFWLTKWWYFSYSCLSFVRTHRL